ncbi:MAG: type II/IV secretion system protein, partial [Proteobacteria bacterium]|nr:type II/IV secretion system protein [Pseudomonadota bacterium]
RAAPGGVAANTTIGRSAPGDDATVVVGAGTPKEKSAKRQTTPAQDEALSNDATLVIGETAPGGRAAPGGGTANPTPGDVAANPTPGGVAANPTPGGVAANPTTGRSAPGGNASGGLLGPVVRNLVDRGILSERETISRALRARDQGLTLFHVFALDSATATNAALYQAVAEHLGTRLIDSRRDLIESVQDVPWLDSKSAEQRGLLLLQTAEDAPAIEYAALDPFDLLQRDWLKARTGKEVTPIPVVPAVFFETITNLKARIEAPKRSDETLIPIDVSWQQEYMLLDKPLSADVPLIVDYILQRCHSQNASDIHLEPTEEGLLIRARIDGILHEESRMPLELHPAVVSRIKVLAGMDVAERRRPQDGRLSVMIRKSKIDVRVSTLPTVLGEKVVMRLLDDEALRPSPEQLGMRDQNLRIMLDKITAPHGLILISGPTGSGKTTTLYSCLSATDRVRRNVITIEDPVEYRLKGVQQMQVNERIGLTFTSGLRTVLRQDPDVIMVGECRDPETGRMAVQAALTGHVVFSTIHANDCISVVTRLLDMKIDSFLVASALSLSMSQRLVRLSCKHCTVMIEGREVLRQLRTEGISAQKMARLGIHIDEKMPCPHSAGCPQCRHTGYSGRQAVFEMLEITPEMRKLIVSDHFEADALKALARESGMTSMMTNGLQLVAEGRTTYSELIRVLGEE